MKAAVVILDAAGPMGRGVLKVALEQRRPVIAVTADKGAMRTLANRYLDADLTVIDGAVSDEGKATQLAATLRELDRPIAGVVLGSCSEPARNRVLDLSPHDVHRLLEADLLPHLAAARHLVPMLAASGRNTGYVVIGSPGSDHPWVGYGTRSIAASAASMLVRVLHEEARSLGVRVQMLAINRPVRTDANRAWSCDGWPDVSAIGTQALELIDQVDPRVAAAAIVPFVKRVADASRAPHDSRPAEFSTLAAEPALLAHMTTEPDRRANGDAGSPRVFGQAWSLLEPLLTSNRNASSRNEEDKP
jgi:NAD(P)-dependent dehydrogenase (short-subunit alcohol dehydrogenase family)